MKPYKERMEDDQLYSTEPGSLREEHNKCEGINGRKIYAEGDSYSTCSDGCCMETPVYHKARKFWSWLLTKM